MLWTAPVCAGACRGWRRPPARNSPCCADRKSVVLVKRVDVVMVGRRRHTIFSRDWSSDVCSSDLGTQLLYLVPEQLWVIANYKETQTFAMRPGQPVTIEVDALDGARLRGRVQRMAPATGSEFAVLR